MKKGVLCVSLVALADWLFYGHPIGWTAGAYSLALAAAVVLAARRSLRGFPIRLLFLSILGLALAQTLQPGPLPAALSLIAVVSLAGVARSGWAPEALVSVRFWGRFAAGVGLQAPRDAIVLWRRYRKRPALLLRGAGGWLGPTLLSLGFASLFAIANPVLESWAGSMGSRLHGVWDLVRDGITPGRLFLWIGLAAAIWALFRSRGGRRGGRRRAPAAPAYGRDRISPGTLGRSLLLSNLVFLVQNSLDAAYLWGGAELPTGMSYAHYAHRGAYPLVLTALLAAAFLLAAFQPGGEGERRPWIRRMVYLWIAQNILLTLSAGWRLLLYVDAYHLTRWRVAAAIWMGLVALGLGWILLRFALRRSNGWLVTANALSAAAVLYAACFVDFDGWIAWHNARSCREAGGGGAQIDIGYLRSLGEESLPALRWLEARLAGSDQGQQAGQAAAELAQELDLCLRDWRGWSLLRRRL